MDSIFYFILAIGLVIVLIGFLRMRRWSWVMLMSWVGFSMVVGLVEYFYFDNPTTSSWPRTWSSPLPSARWKCSASSE